MLKQCESPLWTIFSSTTNYFADEWPAFSFSLRWWYFSFDIHRCVYIVWSSEQQKEHQAAFDSYNWLGQMSTFSSSYPITLALIIQYSCTYLSMSKLVRPHVHGWCYCLYRQLFVLRLLRHLSAFVVSSSFSNSWRPSSQDNSITFFSDILKAKITICISFLVEYKTKIILV